MAIIGYNTIGTVGSLVSGIWARATIGGSFLYTAIEGDAVTRVWAYCFNWGGIRESVEVTVYSMAGDSPLDRLFAPKRIGSTAPAPSWSSTAVANEELRAGQTYCVAWKTSALIQVWFDNYVDEGENNDTGNLTDPWDPRNTQNVVASVYAAVTNFAPPPPDRRYPCCAQLIE